MKGKTAVIDHPDLAGFKAAFVENVIHDKRVVNALESGEVGSIKAETGVDRVQE